MILYVNVQPDRNAPPARLPLARKLPPKIMRSKIPNSKHRGTPADSIAGTLYLCPKTSDSIGKAHRPRPARRDPEYGNDFLAGLKFDRLQWSPTPPESGKVRPPRQVMRHLCVERSFLAAAFLSPHARPVSPRAGLFLLASQCAASSGRDGPSSGRQRFEAPGAPASPYMTICQTSCPVIRSLDFDAARSTLPVLVGSMRIGFPPGLN